MGDKVRKKIVRNKSKGLTQGSVKTRKKEKGQYSVNKRKKQIKKLKKKRGDILRDLDNS